MQARAERERDSAKPPKMRAAINKMSQRVLVVEDDLEAQRYLVNGLREAFKLPGTPIRLTLREKDNPYAGRKKKR